MDGLQEIPPSSARFRQSARRPVGLKCPKAVSCYHDGPRYGPFHVKQPPI